MIAEEVGVIALPESLHRRWMRSKRFMYNRVNQKPWNQRTIGIGSNNLSIDKLFASENHSFGSVCGFDSNPKISPYMRVTKGIRSLHVENSDIRHHRFHCGQSTLQ